MRAKPASCLASFLMCVSVLVFLTACSSRQLSTAAEEKPAPRTELAEPPMAEPSPPASSPPQEKPAEPPQAAPPKIEEAKAEKEAGPQPAPAPTEDVRVAESAAPPIQPVPEVLPPPPAPVLALTDVYFDYDRYAIRNEAKGELAAVARQLKEDNNRKLLIEGHCDDRGTVAYNLVLGERRAQAVKRYLVGLGVSSAQIDTISYGKDKPVCTDPSEDCRQKNRRARFVLQ